MLRVSLIRRVWLRMGGAFFCQEEQRACLNPFASGEWRSVKRCFSHRQLLQSRL